MPPTPSTFIFTAPTILAAPLPQDPIAKALLLEWKARLLDILSNLHRARVDVPCTQECLKAAHAIEAEQVFHGREWFILQSAARQYIREHTTLPRSPPPPPNPSASTSSTPSGGQSEEEKKTNAITDFLSLPIEFSQETSFLVKDNVIEYVRDEEKPQTLVVTQPMDKV